MLDNNCSLKLEKKIVLVTGGSRGIGKQISLQLGLAGAKVYVNYVSSEEKAISCCREIENKGGSAEAIQFDVADKNQVDIAINNIIKEDGGLDILVNNAGISIDGLSVRCKKEDWDRVVNTNLTGTFNCSSKAALFMMKNRSGRIVNITSVVGQMGNAGQVAYASSKAGIIGLTKSMAKEFASRGITVNAVAPGFIETEMTDDLSEKRRQIYLDSIPVGRFGKKEEVAMAVQYLCSDLAGFITGQILGVNGGMYM